MERLKKGWVRVPRHIRKPIVIVIGFLFVVAAGLTGWIPGPGGIPLFLIGIAILATEYEWAERLRDTVLGTLKWFSRQFRQHPVIGGILVAASAVSAALIGYMIYLFFNSL